jgi:hypothetical protein
VPAFGHQGRSQAGQLNPAGAGKAERQDRTAGAGRLTFPRGKALSIIALLVVVGLSGLLGQAAARWRNTTRPVATGHQIVISNPYRTGGLAVQWMRGELHVASTNGVGKDLPKMLGEYFAKHGYQFLAITDQNTYTWTDIYSSHTLTGIPAIGADYPFGSLLALEMDHWLPARDLQSAVDWIRRDGGLPILARPQDPATPELAAQATHVHGLFGLEVYDARLGAENPQAADATALWDRLLSSGQQLFAIAGDDLLSLSGPIEPAHGAWVELLAPAADTDSLLNAIEQGAFYASNGPAIESIALHGKTIQVRADGNATLQFIGRNGRLLQAVSGGSGSYTIRGDEGYVRVEALASDGTRAWSQPFFIAVR